MLTMIAGIVTATARSVNCMRAWLTASVVAVTVCNIQVDDKQRSGAGAALFRQGGADADRPKPDFVRP